MSQLLVLPLPDMVAEIFFAFNSQEVIIINEKHRPPLRQEKTPS